jgi:hypothetical protein
VALGLALAPRTPALHGVTSDIQPFHLAVHLMLLRLFVRLLVSELVSEYVSGAAHLCRFAGGGFSDDADLAAVIG